jgi:hypothetical protein
MGFHKKRKKEIGIYEYEITSKYIKLKRQGLEHVYHDNTLGKQI